MAEEVARKAAEGAGGALGGPLEGLADSALGFLIGPWGLLALVLVFLAIRAIR